jgi:hypothetical protein
MATRRMLPPAVVQKQTVNANGRQFVGVPGSAYDISDFDAGPLSANSWIDCGLSGPTSSRPSSTVGPNALFVGFEYVDSTIGAVVRWDGANWRSVLTGAAV